jgi:hypothetical protein
VCNNYDFKLINLVRCRSIVCVLVSLQNWFLEQLSKQLLIIFIPLGLWTSYQQIPSEKSNLNTSKPRQQSRLGCKLKCAKQNSLCFKEN